MAKSLSEREIIDLIRQQSKRDTAGLTTGIGDDCAVFGSNRNSRWLITTDTLVDSVHFDRSFHPTGLLGRKCVGVSLSDIAAMGGIPRFILISLSMPPELPAKWLKEWFSGVTEICDEFNCSLIGGDTVQSKELSITVTVIGEPGPGGIIYRSGACENDTVYVSGHLGNSGAGLLLLQKKKGNSRIKKWADFINAHLNPVPQVDLGQQLALSGFVTSMQDISDGLATDLSHICFESGVGAILSQISLPQHPKLKDAANCLQCDHLDLQLFQGEDYQLVFTVRQGREKQVESIIAGTLNLAIHPVGRIKKGSGVMLQQTDGKLVDISYMGYEHSMKDGENG